MKRRKALTIAGSDSGGGAGIQADLKTFQERDVFGTSVITAITAQNTHGVHAVYPLSPKAVSDQLRAVMDDIGADAAKTGMLYSAELIERVAAEWKRYATTPLIIDPVMIAKGGAPLLKSEAIDVFIKELLPYATVVTPNLPEAFALAGMEQDNAIKGMKEAAKAIHAFGPKYVLVKGGHMTESEVAVDLLYDGVSFTKWEAPRIETHHTHGTGCTYSAALTAELAKGKSIKEALFIAKQFITAAIQGGWPAGGGIGPTDHAAFRQQHAKASDYVKIEEK